MKRREFPKTFHLREDNKAEEFHLPKFKSEEIKTREDKDEEFSLGKPERVTAHFKDQIQQDVFMKDDELTFREIKSGMDEDDELLHSEVQNSDIESASKLTGLRSNIGYEKEALEKRLEGIKLNERPKMKRFKEKGIFLIREWRLISFLAFISGFYSLLRFMIDLINQ